MGFGRSTAFLPLLAVAAVGCGSTTSETGTAVTPAPRAVVQTEPGANPETTVPVATTSASAPVTAAGPPPSEPASGAEVSSSDAPPSTLDGERTEAEATGDDPVPVGEVIEITDLWDLRVTSVDLDASAEVLAFADINPAPEAGTQYVLITIEGVYVGDRMAQPVFEWSVSDGTTVFRPSIPGCGVIPDSIYDVIEVVPGEAFDANVCVPVSSASVASGLELSLQPSRGKVWVFDL